MRKLSLMMLLAAMMLPLSCSDQFLEVAPKGVLSVQTLSNKTGVEYLLTGAYSLLDGWGGSGTSYHSAVDNHVYGSIASDDAYKGTTSGDQPDQTFIETYNILPDNGYFRGKWRVVYDGVARSNDVLQMLPKATDIPAAEATIMTAEARFLRAHYHFDAKKMWNMVPYIDEVTYDPTDPNSTKVPNDKDIWSKIEADFDFAYKNLDQSGAPRGGQKGRATKWAAAAYLAKAYIFQKKFAEAKVLLEAIVASGKFKLEDKYHDNYRASTRNNGESIFEVQFSVNDGTTGGQNGNNGATLNYPYAGPATCCGFFQPAQNLVNSFKTDNNGLPLLDTFNDVDVANDQGIESSSAWSSTTAYKKGATVTVFAQTNVDKVYVALSDNTNVDPQTNPATWEFKWTESNVNLDPRLDWTVGRRGIPYLDWGVHPGKAWVRDQAYGGPYSPIKHMHYKAERGTLSSAVGNGRQNANNYRMIRYAHILLWLAECEAELGNLDVARGYVNLVRKRAANPAGYVKDSNGNDAANYLVKEYPGSGSYPFDTKDNARKAIRHEVRIEFAMEGHRYFDLVRWGIAAQTLNAYVAGEKSKRSYLNNATFVAGKHEYFPIPAQEILNSSLSGQATLKQNPGY